VAKKDYEYLGGLCQAIKTARRQLQPYREQNLRFVEQYAGPNWGDMISRARSGHVNFLSLYISTMARNLVPKSPRVLLNTFSKRAVPAVSAMQSWCNQESERMGMDATLRRWVVNALFSVGILKVALSGPGDAELSGWNVKAGIPFAEVVELDDFVIDMRAKDFSRVSFVGHRYRAPLDAVRKLKGARKYERLHGDMGHEDPKTFNEDGDERISELGVGDHAGDEEFGEYRDLWEIYLPRERRVLTLDGEAMHSGEVYEPLSDEPWIGPAAGPFHFLGYLPPPAGNLMPKSPVMDLIDLHELGQHLFRKLARQARRQKSVTLVQSVNTEDGQKITNAADGEAIAVNNPESTKAYDNGGPQQANTVFFTAVKDLFSYFSGGLDIFAGLGSDNPTATQDKILNQNSSRAVADLQEQTVQGVSRIYKALCWYWWHHPELVMRVREEVPGMPDQFIVREVHPGGMAPQGKTDRQGSFEEMDVRADPHSLQSRTPQERIQTIRSILQQDVMPLLPVLAPQGIHPDMVGYLKLLAEYVDLPELTRLLQVGEPPEVGQAEAPGAEAAMGKPGMTERRYVRENVPGRSRQGNDNAILSAMTGVDTGGNPNGPRPGQGGRNGQAGVY
jgi:hypothetical protein